MIKRFFTHGHPLAVSATIALVAMLAYQILPPIMSGNFLGQAGNGGAQCAEYGTFTRYITPGSVEGLTPGPSGDLSFLQYDARISGPPALTRFTTAGLLGASMPLPASVSDFHYDALNLADGTKWGISTGGTQYQKISPDGTNAIFNAPGIPQGFEADASGHLYLRSFSMTSQGWATYTLSSIAPDGTYTSLYTAPQNMYMGGAAGDMEGNVWTTLAPAAVYSGSRNVVVVKISASGISTWELPTTERGLDIAIDAQGNAWVSAQSNVFKVTPTGTTTTYPIPWWHTPHTNPGAIDSIIRGTDGNMWALATEQIALTPTNRRGLYVELIKIAPDGTMSKYDVEPSPGFSFDPNHMPSFNVRPPIIGPDGNLWYSYRYSVWSESNSYIVESAIVKVSLCGSAQSPGAGACIGPAAVTRHIVGTAPNQFGQVVPVAVGSDGNVWFTKEQAGKISKLTVPGDVVTDYDIPWGNPVNRPLVKGSDGNIWFTTVDVTTGATTSKITRVTPSGSVAQFDIPAFANGPMVAGPDGNIWFSENALGMAKIAKITPAGTITEYPTSLFAVIQGLAKGSDGNIWFTPSGNGAGWIGKMTTAGVVTQYTLPASVSTNDSIITNTIVIGPDGNVWFTVSNITGNKIGKVTPAGDVTLTDSPIAGSLLIGPDGAIWTVKGKKIGRVANDGSVTEYSLPQSVDVRDVAAFVSGPNQSFWLGGTEILSFGICALSAPLVTEGSCPQEFGCFYDAGSCPVGERCIAYECGNVPGGGYHTVTGGSCGPQGQGECKQCVADSSSAFRGPGGSSSSGLATGSRSSTSGPPSSVGLIGAGPVCPPCRQACGVSGPSCITCGAGTVPTCPAGSIGAPYCDINNKPRCMFAAGGVTSATCGAATQAPPLSCAQCTATYCGPPDVCVSGSSSSGAGNSSSTSSLRPGPGCGDSIVQSPEECDAGSGGSATCDAACKIIVCGNSNECETNLCQNGTCRCDAEHPCPDGQQCDSGTGQCLVPRCGDGVKEISEACDDGNFTNDDGCSIQCQIECVSGDQCDSGICQQGVCEPVCGDGVKETAEPCDDGNTQSGDGCSAQCFLECTDDSACPTGLCTDNVCSATSCGNGVTDQGEMCDDGNGNDADTCSNVCLFGLYQDCIVRDQCESGLCQQGQCSPCNITADCGAGLLCLGRMCAAAPVCGNGKHEFAETCDDGNMDDSDVCSNTCQNGIGLACEADRDCASERCVGSTCIACARADQCASSECTNGRCAPACGNGEIDRGEQCDAGSQNSDILSDQCRKNCLRPQCGDGVQDAGEQCDDGNVIDTDGCTGQCRAVQVQSIMGSGGSGSPCAGNTQCASGICQSGACEGMPPGASCITGAQCVSGSCNSGACSPTETQVANLTGGHAPAGETGPAAVAVMGAGAAAGWAWMKRRRRGA